MTKVTITQKFNNRTRTMVRSTDDLDREQELWKAQEETQAQEDEAFETQEAACMAVASKWASEWGQPEAAYQIFQAWTNDREPNSFSSEERAREWTQGQEEFDTAWKKYR